MTPKVMPGGVGLWGTDKLEVCHHGVAGWRIRRYNWAVVRGSPRWKPWTRVEPVCRSPADNLTSFPLGGWVSLPAPR